MSLRTAATRRYSCGTEHAQCASRQASLRVSVCECVLERSDTLGSLHLRTVFLPSGHPDSTTPPQLRTTPTQGCFRPLPFGRGLVPLLVPPIGTLPLPLGELSSAHLPQNPRQPETRERGGAGYWWGLPPAGRGLV